MAQEAAAAVQAVVRPTIGNMSEMRQALWENMVPGSQEFPVLPQMFTPSPAQVKQMVKVWDSYSNTNRIELVLIMWRDWPAGLSALRAELEDISTKRELAAKKEKKNRAARQYHRENKTRINAKKRLARLQKKAASRPLAILDGQP